MTKYEDGYSLGRAVAQQEIITKLLELLKSLECESVMTND